MKDVTKHVVFTGIACGLISILYFFSLVFHIPFWAAVPLVFCALFFFYRRLFEVRKEEDELSYPLLMYAILAAGIVLMIFRSGGVTEKYGGWDAWCFWNVHAKYMAGGIGTWRHIFLNTLADHTDYPLLVPGINGFFMHLFAGNFSVIIPFIFSFCITLFIPVVLYVELAGKNLILAAFVLLLFCRDDFYLRTGLSQYADTALAFFFLCAMVSLKQGEGLKKNIAISALCLGCCAWTKNEGVILASVFIAFNFGSFFMGGHVKYFVAGIALPLLAIVLFKVQYAHTNDILNSQSSVTLQQIFMKERYALIYQHFAEQLGRNFPYTGIAFILYVVLCALRREMPDRQFFMFIACMAVYLMIYLMSTQNLEWHLITSLERLMHQLMPAMIFVIALKFADVRFKSAQQ